MFRLLLRRAIASCSSPFARCGDERTPSRTLSWLSKSSALTFPLAVTVGLSQLSSSTPFLPLPIRASPPSLSEEPPETSASFDAVLENVMKSASSLPNDAVDSSLDLSSLAVALLFIATVSAAAFPFLAPALRTHILPYVPATPAQISSAFQAVRAARSDGKLREALRIVARDVTGDSKKGIARAGAVSHAEGMAGSAWGEPPRAVIDLGSGDGRVVLAAVDMLEPRHAVGVELNSWLVLAARLRALRGGYASKARVEFFSKDLWATSLTEFDVVFVFGVKEMMHDLQKKLKKEMALDAVVVCTRFPLPDWEPYYHSGITSLYVHPNVLKAFRGTKSSRATNAESPR